MDTKAWLILAAVVAAGLAVGAAVLLVRVFAARRLLLDAGIPLRDKALFWVAVVYTISPLDLIPDPVYLDDIGVLLLALRSLHAAAARIPGGPRPPVDPAPVGHLKGGRVR
ncbi:YkvA family protein [Streptomyces sp. NPDC051555]|uniref:YkvA family protein n=1 Tax=Streptomyces sp. NPDC051555 TaxID=3365657 RepID=UPI00378C0E66